MVRKREREREKVEGGGRGGDRASERERLRREEDKRSMQAICNCVTCVFSFLLTCFVCVHSLGQA